MTKIAEIEKTMTETRARMVAFEAAGEWKKAGYEMDYLKVLKAKKAYFNEDACELSLASQETLDELIEELDAQGYDGGFAQVLWDMGNQEMKALAAEARAEFGLDG